MGYTIDVMIAEGDMVSLFYSWTATHTGELGGIQATGRTVSAVGAMARRVSGGKIVEEWDLDDRLGVMQQLALLPASASPASAPDGN
jgi:predicted ester cyclase